MRFFKRLRLVFAYGPEIEEMLEAARKEREHREREEKKDRLNLCFRHQPRNPGSHYAEHNCDYCRLKAEGAPNDT